MEKIVVLLHGMKSPNENDFDYFFEYAKNKTNVKLIKFDFFENNNKKTLTSKKFVIEINKELDKYKNFEIILVAYSLGSSLAIEQIKKRTNISKSLLIVPVWKISLTKWILLLKENRQLKKRLKEKIGKERYKSLQDNKSKNSTIKNKYPVKLVFSNYRAVLRGRKYLKKLDNATIDFIFCKKDFSVNGKKNQNFLSKKLDIINNKINIEWVDQDHFLFFKNNQIENFEKILNFINKE